MPAAASARRISVRHVVVGGEAQLYWNELTLYVQGGYDTTAGSREHHRQRSRRGSCAAPAATSSLPNTMLEGTVLYANGEIKYDNGFVPASGPTNGFETWLWEVKLEHRFAATPFSLFVEVSWLGNEVRYTDSSAPIR